MARPVLVFLLLVGSCTDASLAEPPVLSILSPTVLTFAGVPSSVAIETDRRTRFAVTDPQGAPRGAGLAEKAGRYEVPFDTSELAAEGAELRVTGVSDDGGRTELSFAVRGGFQGLVVEELEAEDLLDAVLLEGGRLAVVSAAAIWAQTAPSSEEFDVLSSEGGQALAPAAGGGLFVGRTDDEIRYYDPDGALCARFVLPAAEAVTGTRRPSENVVDIDVAPDAAPSSIEVLAAHDLGFAGFGFTGTNCSAMCSPEPCELGSPAFSQGTCLLANVISDPRSRAVAIDGDRAYAGRHSLNIVNLAAHTTKCFDLGEDGAPSDGIVGFALTDDRIWIATDTVGVESIARESDPDAPLSGYRRFDGLPEIALTTISATARGDGAWFGGISGLGRLRVDRNDVAQIEWISGYSLPGRSVRAIVQPPSDPPSLWVATDGGLAKLVLPD